MKNLPVILIVLGTVGLTGCPSVPSATAGGDATEQVREMTHPYFPEAAQALKDGSYEMLEKHLSGEMRERITGKNFDEMVKTLHKSGEIRAVEFVTVLDGDILESEIWKIKIAGRDEQGRSKNADKLLRLVFGTLDGRKQIVGLLIQ